MAYEVSARRQQYVEGGKKELTSGVICVANYLHPWHSCDIGRTLFDHFHCCCNLWYFAEQHWYYVLFFSCTLIDALIKCHLSKKNSLTKFVKIAGSAPFNKGRTKADFHEDGISLLFFSDEVKKDCQRLPQSITIYQIGNRRLSMI